MIKYEYIFNTLSMVSHENSPCPAYYIKVVTSLPPKFSVHSRSSSVSHLSSNASFFHEGLFWHANRHSISSCEWSSSWPELFRSNCNLYHNGGAHKYDYGMSRIVCSDRFYEYRYVDNLPANTSNRPSIWNLRYDKHHIHSRIVDCKSSGAEYLFCL